MDRENGNGNTVLLTVIGVATLLVALVGATFAYFSATITNEAKESVIITTAAPVGLEYLGSTLVLADDPETPEIDSNAIPGDEATGTFTVKNPSTSTVAQTYDLTLVIDKNEFVAEVDDMTTAGNADLAKEQLLITITSEADLGTEMHAINSGNPYNLTDSTTTESTYQIVDNQRIAIGETQTYTIKVEFKELSIAQNPNQNKAFQAHIEISDPVSVK